MVKPGSKLEGGQVMKDTTETTSMRSWQSGWSIVPVNAYWGLVPGLVAGTIALSEPPIPNSDFSTAEQRYTAATDELTQSENMEDLEDALRTKLQYESEGEKGFTRYGDYRKTRS